jgi:transcriptional regulator with XRE-family HTH domain
MNIIKNEGGTQIVGKYVKENLTQLVRRVIRQKNLTLRQVQEKAGGRIDESYVSRIMSGNTKNISLDKLIALAHGIEQDPHALFTAYYGCPPASKQQPQEVFELNVPEFISLMQKVSVNPELIEIIKEALELQPEECAAAIRYVSYLNERKRKAKQSRSM